MNIPNILTVSRIGIVVVFVILAALSNPTAAWHEQVNILGSHLDMHVFVVRLIALVLAAVAAFTDFVDGYLARKWHQITDFGALMDPLADKIFVTATMLVAVEYRLMPAWIVTAVLAREFMVTGLRTLAARKGVVIAADGWGKIKTVMQMGMIALAGLSWCGWLDLRRGMYEWHDFAHQPWQRIVWLLALCVIVLVTLGSGVKYFITYRRLFREDRRA